jgi:hypothetical protein
MWWHFEKTVHEEPEKTVLYLMLDVKRVDEWTEVFSTSGFLFCTS